MPKPPLIRSPERREAVIAALMAAAFAGTLIGAWLITGAPWY